MKRSIVSDFREFERPAKTRVPADAAEARRQPEHKDLYYCTNTLEETCLTSAQMKAQNLNPNDYALYRSEQECKQKCRFGEEGLVALIANYAGDPTVYEYKRFENVPKGDQYALNKEIETLVTGVEATLAELASKIDDMYAIRNAIAKYLYNINGPLWRIAKIWSLNEGFSNVWRVVSNLWTIYGYYDRIGNDEASATGALVRNCLASALRQKFPVAVWMEAFLSFLKYNPHQVYLRGAEWFIETFKSEYDQFDDIQANKNRYLPLIYALFGLNMRGEGRGPSEYFKAWTKHVEKMRSLLPVFREEAKLNSINEVQHVKGYWISSMERFPKTRHLQSHRYYMQIVTFWPKVLTEFLPLGIGVLIWEIAYLRDLPFDFEWAAYGFRDNSTWGLSPQVDAYVLNMLKTHSRPYANVKAPTDAYISSELAALTQPQQLPSYDTVRRQYRTHELKLAEVVVKGIENWTVKVSTENQVQNFRRRNIEKLLARQKEIDEKARLAEEGNLNPPVANPAAVPASAAAAAGIVVEDVVVRPAAAAAAAAVDITNSTAEVVSSLLNPARRGGLSIIQQLF